MVADAKSLQRQALAANAEEAVDPSMLDRASHEEMLMLYRECCATIRFVKAQQWIVLGGSLCAFFALGLAARATPIGSEMPRVAVAFSIALNVCAIYALVIYHFRQSAERAKLAYISAGLSSLLRQARALTWQDEALIHRSVMLIFKIMCLISGNALLALAMESRLQPPL